MKCFFLLLVYCFLSIFYGYSQTRIELVKQKNNKIIKVDSDRTMVFYMKDGTTFRSKVSGLKNDSLFLGDTTIMLNSIKSIKYRYRNVEAATISNVITGGVFVYFSASLIQIFTEKDYNFGHVIITAALGVGLGIIAIPTIIINTYCYHKSRFDLVNKWKIQKS